MPIYSIADFNNNNRYGNQTLPAFCAKNSKQRKNEDNEPKAPDAPTKVKVASLIGTLIGVSAAMFYIFKQHKELPLKTVKDYFKNFTKITYNSKKKETEKLVGALAIGSVGGGLIGGSSVDKKKNIKAKFRESIIQLIGNIGTPLLCVSVGIRQFEKHLEPKLIKKLKLTGKAKSIPKIGASAGLLIVAIIAGNKIGNLINQKMFKTKENRKLKLSDMSPHIDDACLALSLVASDSSAVVSRLIPAALTIAGYSTGTAQQKHEGLNIFELLQPQDDL